MADEQLILVAQWEQQKEQHCAQQYHQAQQYMLQQKTRLESVEHYRREYIDSISRAGENGFDAKQYSQHLAFVSQLDNACQQQSQILSQAVLVAEQRKQEWLNQQRKRKAIEHVIEKKAHARRVRAERLEQAQLDEFAIQRFVRATQKA